MTSGDDSPPPEPGEERDMPREPKQSPSTVESTTTKDQKSGGMGPKP